MAAESHQLDPRHVWLEDWLGLKLGVKADRFRKLLASPDEVAAINSFLDMPDCMCVFFSMKDKDLVASQQLPAKLKKVVYFVKVTRGSISPQNIDSNVTSGELTSDMLGQLFKLCQEVGVRTAVRR